MMEELKLGGIYQHYKGMSYRVIHLGRHSETLEWLVVYECLYENPGGKIWVRPMDMFTETVEVNGRTVPRFKYISNDRP
jgi:hypothetical protein